MPKTHLRTEYSRDRLEESDAGTDPLALFERWFDDAVQAAGRDPNAMSLATVDAHGQPDVRIVLCKQFDVRGFVFFTNYDSRKGEQLADNPKACLLFYWPALERQVRVKGAASRIPASESDAYFDQRPLDARIGAWASPQSHPIPDRTHLEQSVAAAAQRFAGAVPPRPTHWGGYRLEATSFEFWQGRPSRLHDRLVFTRPDGAWVRERLAP